MQSERAAGAPEVPTPTQAEANAIKEEAHGLAEPGPEPGPEPTDPPSVLDTPYLSGASTVGASLTCTMGNWNGEPTSYDYAWKRDGADVTSGAANTYTVLAADAGKSICCVVTATNAIGSAAAPPSNSIPIDAAAA